MLKNNALVTYEVKTDFKCAPLFDTGNLFIEYECRNKPSGISISQSDWFVTYFIYLLKKLQASPDCISVKFQ